MVQADRRVAIAWLAFQLGVVCELKVYVNFGLFHFLNQWPKIWFKELFTNSLAANWCFFKLCARVGEHKGVILVSQVHNPKHDPAGYRVVPNTSRELNQDRVTELLAKEWELFKKTTKLSGKENVQASKSLPMGVTSSFQHWDPYPI